MKLIRHGLVFIFCIHLTLIALVGCATFHQIIFSNQACIKPYKQYDYLTCQRMKIKIDGETYVIPKDFKTDLASIPRPLWPLFAPQYTSYVAPAILHDYLYRCHTDSTRQFADDVFYSALITQGVSAFTAAKFYMAVRIFGGDHFGEHNKDC